MAQISFLLRKLLAKAFLRRKSLEIAATIAWCTQSYACFFVALSSSMSFILILLRGPEAHSISDIHPEGSSRPPSISGVEELTQFSLKGV